MRKAKNLLELEKIDLNRQVNDQAVRNNGRSSNGPHDKTAPPPIRLVGTTSSCLVCLSKGISTVLTCFHILRCLVTWCHLLTPKT